MRYARMAGIFVSCALLGFEASYADQALQPQFSDTKPGASQAATASASSDRERQTASDASQEGSAKSEHDRPGSETRVGHSKNAPPLARRGNTPLAANHQAASGLTRRAINSRVTAPRPVRSLVVGTELLKAPAPAFLIVPHRALNPAAISGTMNAKSSKSRSNQWNPSKSAH